MNATTDQPRRIFTRARIAALAVIGVLVVGLAYLRFAPGDDPVSVWAGAKPGDVKMHSCTYSTEQGDVPADCGTLVVPENRADRRSRLIALPVTRIRSHSAHPREPIFRLEGGPGLSNMTFPQASRYLDQRDVVLVGYRGVDGSSRLDCPEVTSVLKRSPDFLAASSARAGEGVRGLRRSAPGRRRRPCGLHARAAGRRLRGGAHGTRIRPHRPRERERGNARGDGLRVASPVEHPSVRDDRREPAGPLRVGRADHRRSDRALLAALRTRHFLPRPGRRSGRVDARDVRRHARPLDVPADRVEQRPARVLLRARQLGTRRVADLRPDDARLVDPCRRRRRERLLAPVGPEPDGVPRDAGVGRRRVDRA